MSVIVIRINDRKKSEDEVLNLLQTVCSGILKKEEKLRQLKEYGIRLDAEIEGKVNTMCNLSDYVEARGELRARKQMALKMLQKGNSYEDVAECADVSVETVKEWEQEALALA